MPCDYPLRHAQYHLFANNKRSSPKGAPHPEKSYHHIVLLGSVMRMLLHPLTIFIFHSLVQTSDAAISPNVTLSNDVVMPVVALGMPLGRNAKEKATEGTNLALDNGLVHIDTAMTYFNQRYIGVALAERRRDSYFLTTKVPGCAGPNPLNADFCYRSTKGFLQRNLNELSLQYVDLVLLHWPPQSGGNYGVGGGGRRCVWMRAQWKAMQEFYRDGKSRAIGVSNYCIKDLKCLRPMEVQPMVNQIPFFPGTDPNPNGLYTYSREIGMILQAYSPLHGGRVLKNPQLKEIGQKYNKTAAQVALRWIIQHNYTLVSAAYLNKQYIIDDLDIFDFDMTEEEIARFEAWDFKGTTCLDLPNPKVKLYNNVELPLVATGVWGFSNIEAEKSVTSALNLGYTAIDTAKVYNNQVGVGKALADMDRDLYFLETKIPGCNLELTIEECKHATRSWIEEDFIQLGTTEIDLMLLHGPAPGGCTGRSCTLNQIQWTLMEEMYESNGNSSRAIGVSNYNIQCLQCLEKTQRIAPMVNQVGFHLGMWKNPLVQENYRYYKSKGIIIQAYSPLASGDPRITEGTNLTKSLAKKYQKTPAQIALKYIVQQGIAFVTASKNTEYMKQNADLFDFELLENEINALNQETLPPFDPNPKVDPNPPKNDENNDDGKKHASEGTSVILDIAVAVILIVSALTICWVVWKHGRNRRNDNVSNNDEQQEAKVEMGSAYSEVNVDPLIEDFSLNDDIKDEVGNDDFDEGSNLSSSFVAVHRSDVDRQV
eukprot:jgi/Bigna1/90475/estExt_fgenesh1_pg.C_710059